MSEPIDIYPNKGFYRVGDSVSLHVGLDGAVNGVLDCRIFNLAVEVARFTTKVVVQEAPQDVDFEWQPPHVSHRGYGVQASLTDDVGVVMATGSTAFDVLEDWTSYPRYGFLCDFSSERTDVTKTFEELTRFHVNGLQFYDWLYRHDDPVPATDLFLDPLNRPLSLTTVRQLIEEAHVRGMASMAYIAVYASSMDLWREQPAWALYDEDGEPIVFDGDFLGLMDPTQGTRWAEHLQRRCDEILASLSFDGIHIDQYGEPRTAFTAEGNPVDLPGAFTGFVSEFKKRHPESPTTFNAVKNWPIDSLVKSPMDFVYIELWPDTPTYREIGEVVESAYRSSGNKPVVIALYLPTEREKNIRLANALIVAHGGSRIELGENGRLLSDPYFPRHEALSPGLHDTLKRSSDFRVRYGELLGPCARPSDTQVKVPNDMWLTVRDIPGWVVINLVNMQGIAEARWDSDHREPALATDIAVDIDTVLDVQRVWAASPDSKDLSLQPLEWAVDDGTVHVVVPLIEFWTMVAIEFKLGKGS